MLYTATFASISFTVTVYIVGIFFFSLKQFLWQPFLQPHEDVCVILCGGLGGFVDLAGISLSFSTARP